MVALGQHFFDRLDAVSAKPRLTFQALLDNDLEFLRPTCGVEFSQQSPPLRAFASASRCRGVAIDLLRDGLELLIGYTRFGICYRLWIERKLRQ